LERKREREGIGGSLVWKREKGRGVLAKWPSSSLARTGTEVEGEGARAAAARRTPGHGCGRRGEKKKEGDEGVLLTSSPWATVRCGGGSWAAADWWRRCQGAAALWGSGVQGQLDWCGVGRRGGGGGLL
jgi:hypothetical protein